MNRLRIMNYKISPSLISFIVFFTASYSYAEEGMWSYDHLPSEQIQQKYNVKFSQSEITKLQRASVQVNKICSGAFISPTGLIQTNSHCLYDIYSRDDDFGKKTTENGFVAADIMNERKLPDFSIQFFDNSIYPDIGTEKAVEDELATYRVKYCAEKEPSECIVSIDNSGKLRVDNYKTIKDVRLVFLPEMNIGLFGFMKDNFRFPHYSVDVAFLRAYDEKGKPLKSDDYFKWGKEEPKKGDVVFTSGYPGYSFRNRTYQQVLFEFNTSDKVMMELNGAAIDKMIKNKSTLNKGEIFDLKNTFDAYSAVENSINNGAIKKSKDNEEAIVRKFLADNPNELEEDEDPWTRSQNLFDDNTSKKLHNLFIKLALMEVSPYAMKIAMPVDMLGQDVPDEVKKPSSYNAANEKLKIASWGEALIKTLDKDDVPLFLKKYTPDEFANKVVAACPEFFVPNKPVSEKSKECENNPQVKQLANLINFSAMKFGLIYSNVNSGASSSEITETVKNLKTKALPTRYNYDDAKSELRFSFGQILPEEGSQIIATQIGEFYKQETEEFDRILPKKWKNAKARINHSVAMNFLSTNDVVGGNSGSPIFTKDMIMIGSVFDGNQEAAGNMYFFSDKMRTISVSNAAISEALSKVYNMNWLLDEINPSKMQ